MNYACQFRNVFGAVQQLRNAERGRGVKRCVTERSQSNIKKRYERGRGGQKWGLSDALRSVVKVTLKSVTKGGGGGVKNRPKKRYVIVERPLYAVVSNLRSIF